MLAALVFVSFKVYYKYIFSVVAFFYAVATDDVEQWVDGEPHAYAHYKKFKEYPRIFFAFVPYLVNDFFYHGGDVYLRWYSDSIMFLFSASSVGTRAEAMFSSSASNSTDAITAGLKSISNVTP